MDDNKCTEGVEEDVKNLAVREYRESGAIVRSRDNDLWGQYVPAEILLRIFKETIGDSGPIPIMCRVARVCTHWCRVSCWPELWETLDLSSGWIPRSHVGLKMLAELCQYKLKHTKTLNLTAWLGMTDNDLRMICESCPNLESINLCHCSSLTAEGLKVVTDTCQHIQELDVSVLSPGTLGKRVIGDLFKQRGETLTKINLSHNMLYGSIFSDIMVNCKELRWLELSEDNAFYCIDIERFHVCLPNLEVIKFGSSTIRGSVSTEEQIAMSGGWPELQIFEAPKNVTEDILFRMLKCSTKLEELDINTTASGELPALPLNNLQKFRMPKVGMVKCLLHLRKWSQTISELDLSWPERVGRIDFDRAVIKVFPPETVYPNLKRINLCGSPISCHGLCPILQRCPRLTYINLVLCKLLPLGWGVEYIHTDIDRLYRLSQILKPEIS